MLTRSVRLADQDAKLPWPGQPGGFAPRGDFTVSAVDPLAALLLADGSLVPGSATSPAPQPAAKAKT